MIRSHKLIPFKMLKHQINYHYLFFSLQTTRTRMKQVRKDVQTGIKVTVEVRAEIEQ